MSPALDDVRGLTATLVASPVDVGGHDRAADAERVETIAAMERLKSALCAAQADLAVGLDASVREQDRVAGVPAARRGRGVAAQVALARQESPHRGQVLLGLAKDLATDLSCTRKALYDGSLNEFRAMIVARESGILEREDRARIDEDICGAAVEGGRPGLDGVGTKRLVGELRKRCYALDPASVVRRARRAETERRVSTRPAPDAMAYLTGLLPMVQAITAQVALGTEADRLRAEGDPRTRGQLMADLMVERLTGQNAATTVPIALGVVMSDASLLGAGHEPATVPGWGPVPAQIAREAIARATEATQAWIRRLYADPTGQLVALATKQRLVTDGIGAYLQARDQGLCRTPWCDAPTRHADHIVPADHNGPTTAENLQGLCEACNHTKQAPRWTHHVVDDFLARHTVETITPTGHRHRSRAPTPPTPAPAPAPELRVDLEWRLLERLGHAA